MAATRRAVPTAIAGIGPNIAVPAVQREASEMTASQIHTPAFARLLPRSPGTSAHAL